MKHRIWPSVFCGTLALLLSVAPVRACTIPVFRYALERWQPEPYEGVLFHRGPLTPEQQKVLALLAGDEKAPANLTVTPIDVDGKLAGRAAKLWASQPESAKASLPLLLVNSGDADEKAGPVYAGPLEAAAITKVIDSPARREIAARIMKGETAVWVLIESGDAARDAAAAALLTDSLAAQQKALKLPVQDPEAPGPKLRSALPLKVEFSVLRIAAGDAAESSFVRMLLLGAVTPAAGKARGPVVVPVFGQGRALIQLEGEDLTRESIEHVSKFLVGECSCQVKELNPGHDLLMCANWASVLDEELAAQPDEPGQGRRAAIPDPVIGSGKPKPVE
jgi:hypothetical protein